MRTLLILVTLFCIFFGTIGSELVRVYRQQSIVAEIEKHSGRVAYTFGPFRYDDRFFRGWFRRSFGSDFYNPLIYVGYNDANANLTDEHLEILKGLPDLMNAHIFGTNVTDASIETFQSLPNLHSVMLSDVRVSPAGLQRLASQPSIRSLSLVGNFLTDQHLASLSTCTQLTNLQLLEAPLITPSGMNRIGALSNLEQLDLFRFPALNDEAVEFLPLLKNLRELRILSGKITDSTIAEIGQLPELEVLMLGGFSTPITDESLVHLRTLEGLVSLELVGSSISDRGMSVISTLNSLQTLNVSHTRITDACVDDILKLSELRHLDVSGTDLTVTGILKLGELKTLEYFSATVEADQQQQIELRLQKLLPDCYIDCWAR